MNKIVKRLCIVTLCVCVVLAVVLLSGCRTESSLSAKLPASEDATGSDHTLPIESQFVSPGTDTLGKTNKDTKSTQDEMTADVSSADNANVSDQAPSLFDTTFIGAFDTVTMIKGYADDEAAFKRYADEATDMLMEYHRLYDIYNTYPGINNLKTLNDSAGQGPVAVDERIIDLLLRSKQAFEETDGKLNVALGAVLRIWHDYREAGLLDPENARLPDMAELRAAAEHCDMDDVLIDPMAGTVELLDPDMSLDVGAIAKGYVVELVAQHMQAEGVEHAVLSVGGNVRAIGFRDAQSAPWRIGVRNPVAGEPEVAVVHLSDASLVTSGVYERFYTVDGTAYHHIIDPATLFPSNHYLSLSVVCSDSGLADILSTALFNLDLEAGQELLENFPDTDVIWILSDRSIVKTDGLK